MNPQISARAMLLVVLAGVAAFVALLLASAYAPDLAPSGSGGAHALSASAVGFKGVEDLLDAADAPTERIRDETRLDTVALLVLTPEAGTDGAEVARRIALHGDAPALIVLPKWATLPLPAKRGWVQQAGTLPEAATATLAGITKAAVLEGKPGDLRARGFVPGPTPEAVQTIAGPDLRPLIADRAGGIVLAQVGDKPLYILADPDLLNNHGMGNPATARAALRMLAAIGPPGARSIAFDLTLNGFARHPNLLRLAFEPPFLALTLALAGAALLAGIQAAFRFGAPLREARAIQLGKAALVENSAALVTRARREHRAGAGYALLTRDAVAAATGAPLHAGDDALDIYLDRLGPRDGGGWRALAASARDAGNRAALLDAARALHRWRRSMMRDG